MTDMDEVHFISFKANPAQNTLPVGRGVYTQVIISGQIFKGSFSGFTVSVIITKPDGTLDQLSITPDSQTDIARFETPYNLDQDSPVGKYTLLATYIQANISSQTSFKVNKA